MLQQQAAWRGGTDRQQLVTPRRYWIEGAHHELLLPVVTRQARSKSRLSIHATRLGRLLPPPSSLRRRYEELFFLTP